MAAYYNEFDKGAAAWLRELIKAELIAPGEVDERSITEVRPSDITGYTQCHFFAGIGGWSWALRQAGWADSKPVWSGSCPCTPFSVAGKRKGFNDPRHLWPEFFRLIRKCRPDTVFGEQVASPDGLAWLDLVATDLEGENYAVGACSTAACGFGAPHIRRRLYWVAHTNYAGSQRFTGGGVPLKSLLGRVCYLAGRTSAGPSMASGQGQNGYLAQTEKKGRLNPALARWLQGYPVAFCVCAVTATHSVHRRHKLS